MRGRGGRHDSKRHHAASVRLPLLANESDAIEFLPCCAMPAGAVRSAAERGLRATALELPGEFARLLCAKAILLGPGRGQHRASSKRFRARGVESVARRERDRLRGHAPSIPLDRSARCGGRPLWRGARGDPLGAAFELQDRSEARMDILPARQPGRTEPCARRSAQRQPGGGQPDRRQRSLKPTWPPPTLRARSSLGPAWTTRTSPLRTSPEPPRPRRTSHARL